MFQITSSPLRLTLLAGVVLTAASARASSLATDDGSNTPYADGWTSGDNGGTGFGAWSLSPQPNGNGGFFINDSSRNGSGTSGSIGAQSFGIYANSGQLSSAIRPFTGSLAVGQTFRAGFDNGFVDGGGPLVGLQLLTASDPNSPRFEYLFFGGQGGYNINPNTDNYRTATGFSADGMNLSFTLTAANTYSLSIAFNGGATETFTGNLEGTAGNTIDSFRVFNYIAGTGSSNDLYVNSLSIVPEPSTFALIGAACLVGAIAVNRRRRQATLTT